MIYVAHMGDPILFEFEEEVEGMVIPVKGSMIRVSLKLFETAASVDSYEVHNFTKDEEDAFRGWFPASECEELRDDRELHNIYRQIYNNCIGV